MKKFSVTILALVAMLSLSTATAQDMERINEVLAFDLSQVPEAQELLNAIEGREDYQSPAAKYQALNSIQSALTSLGMSFPFGTVEPPSKQAEIDDFRQRIEVIRATYSAEKAKLEPLMEDDRLWYIDNHSLQLAILKEFLPAWGELNPDLLARKEQSAKDQAQTAVSQDRVGYTSITVFAIPLLIGLLIALVRTFKRVSDPEFAFELSYSLATVVREDHWTESEVKGTISGGGTTVPGFVSNVVGRIWTEKTFHQEITLRLDNGMETLLEYTNFELPCGEGNTLALINVNRPGYSGLQGAINNNDRDQLHTFVKEIRKSIRPPKMGMPWITWWLLFAYFGVAASWLGGATIEDGVAVISLTAIIMATVPTILVSIPVWFISRIVTRARATRVEAEMHNLAAQLRQQQAATLR